MGLPFCKGDWQMPGAISSARLAPANENLPILIEASASRGSTLTRLLLLLPAVVAFSLPIAGLAFASSDVPSMIGTIAEKPMATAQIGVGIMMWFGLFIWPATRTFGRLFAKRRIAIGEDSIEITERGILGERRRRVSISDYQGIAHHIRASLSGLTHEIVLVHRDSTLNVTLKAGDRVTQTMIDEAKAWLGLPEVPARSIYERGQRAGVAAGASEFRAA